MLISVLEGLWRVGSTPLYPAGSGMCDQTLLQNKSPPLGCVPGAPPLWVSSGTTSQGVGNFPFQTHVPAFTSPSCPNNHYNTAHRQLCVKGAKPWWHRERESWAMNQPTVTKGIASWFHVTQLLRRRGLPHVWLRLLWAYLPGSLCKLTLLVTQPWSPSSSSPIVPHFYPQAKAQTISLSSPHWCFWEQGLFLELLILYLLQVTTAPFKVPKVPRNTLNWPLLCPISFQALQALISSFYQDVSIQGQRKSSLPKIPVLSFRSFLGCSLLWQHKVGGQSRWRGQKVPLDGFWLSHRLREMSTLERLWPCDALLKPAHLRAAFPVMSFQANKQA